MARTKLVVEFFLPTTSINRVQDCMGEVVKVVESHKGTTPFVVISGPHSDNGEVKNGEEQGSELGRARRADSGSSVAAGTGDNGTGAGIGTDTGEPVKRGRGRPPGSGKARSGSSEEGRGTDDASGASSSEGTRNDEPVRTREGADKGSTEGRSGSRGSTGSGDDQRGDREEAGLDEGWDEEASGDDWSDADDENDEEWHAKTPGHEIPDRFLPKEIDKATVQQLLADHYKATGGKDRGPTFDLMDDAVGSKQLSNVSEADYKKLAKALIKDTWRYRYGVKKSK